MTKETEIENNACVFFDIPGKAHGKGRPRFTKSGHAYTDSKTASFEGVVRRMASDAMKAAGHNMAQGQAVRVEMLVEVPCPVSYSAKKRKAALAGELPPFKPDVDNIAKSILDAMNGIVFDDDSRVTCLTVEKKFTAGPAVTTVRVAWRKIAATGSESKN